MPCTEAAGCINCSLSGALGANVWDEERFVLRAECGVYPQYSDRRLAAGLSDLLGRPWFQRVWVLQEVACARVATVVCGVHSISTRTFAMLPLVWHLEEDVDPHVQAVLELMPGPMRRDSPGSGSSGANDRALATLLKKFEHSKASVKLDRVYALLGISSDASDPDYFPPVYSLSEEEVVFNTMLFLVLGYTRHSVEHQRFGAPTDFSDARYREMRGRRCTVTDLIQALQGLTPLWTYLLDWAVMEHQDKLVARLVKGPKKTFETDLSALDVGAPIDPMPPLAHRVMADMVPRHVAMYDQLLKQVVEPRDDVHHQVFLRRLGQLRSRLVARTTLFRFVQLVVRLHSEVDIEDSTAGDTQIYRRWCFPCFFHRTSTRLASSKPRFYLCSHHPSTSTWWPALQLRRLLLRDLGPWKVVVSGREVGET
ncbi:HET-domain-containing protein [Apiospora aurea]|uniref:HET-domain-containing protein n=1 Tax=Apiospora aurea TaxID=335848 RepID=A0ABR1QKZ7_9PEZI